MAASVDDLKTTMQEMAKQFAGFQEMMSTSLDKLSSVEAWRTTAQESMETLLKRTTDSTARIDDTAARIQRLEFRLRLRLHRHQCSGKLVNRLHRFILYRSRGSTSIPRQAPRQVWRHRGLIRPWGMAWAEASSERFRLVTAMVRP